MRSTRRYFVPQHQEAVLHETAAGLLTEEGQSVPDWEIVGPQIAAEIDRQSDQLLLDAEADYDAFEVLRTQAIRAHGRADPVVCALVGVLAGYLFLAVAGPQFLSSAAANPGLGFTPWLLLIIRSEEHTSELQSLV